VAATTISATTGITAASDGVHAGIETLVGNTTNPAIPSNEFGWLGFNSASAASYFLQPSTTAPAGNYLQCAAPVSGVSACTWGAGGSSTPYFYTSSYTGTPDQMFQSCENAALAVGGICDASSLTGAQSFAAGITEGNSTGGAVGVIWPAAATWSFPSLSGTCMFTQYMNTANWGLSTGQLMFSMVNTSGSGNALCGAQVLYGAPTAGFGYWSMKDVYFVQHGGGVSSGVFVSVQGGSDHSGMEDVDIFDSSTTDTYGFSINPGSNGNQPCCGSLFKDMLVDSNSVGPTPCSVLGTNNGVPNAIVFENVNCNHPKAGASDWYLADSSTNHTMNAAIYNPYVEPDMTGDTATTVMSIAGPRAVSVYSPRFKCEVGSSTKPFITTSSYATSLTVTDFSDAVGGAACEASMPVVINGATGNTITADATGRLAYYSSAPSTLDSTLGVSGLATLTGGATVPSGGTVTIASGATLTCASGSTCPAAGTIAFPATVSGTATQYHFPVFATTTSLANDSTLNDNGTTLGYTGTGGMGLGASPPAISGTPTAGGMLGGEGSGPTTASAVDTMWADSTFHDWAVNVNGGGKKLVGSSIGYNSGSISASVSSTNVASNVNFPTGQYVLSCDVAVTAVGSSPTLAVTIGWTDITGTARTKTCTTGVVTISDNPVTQTITSNGSAALTVTQTLAVSTATWWTTVAVTRLQ